MFVISYANGALGGLDKDSCPLSEMHNNLDAGTVPEVLKHLNTIEKRCLSLVNTFFSLVILPAFPVGQFGMKGLVVHFPMSVEEVSSVFKCYTSSIACVYPSSYSQEPQMVNICKVKDALEWLSKNNPLYFHSVNANYSSSVTRSDMSPLNITDCIEMGSVSEEYISPSHLLSSNHLARYTLPVSNNFVDILTIAHGEEKAFPTLFPFGRNGFNADRPIKLTPLQYYRSRLYNKDERWRTDIPYLLSAVNSFERKRLFELISVYMRVQNPERQPRVFDLLQSDFNQNFIRNSYMFMKNIRGTVAYWKDVLYNLLAMIKNLGCPTFFMTLSANDYHWFELSEMLKVPLKDLPYAVQINPLFAALHFERRWRALLNNVLKGKDAPLGKIQDYFARVEFQSRGSPHMHMFIWVENAPSLYTSNADELTSFIDSKISTVIPDKTLYPILNKLVKKLQIHSHRPSCQRRNRCRFSFPYEPCNETKILSALDILQSKKFYVTRRTKNDTMVNAYNPTILMHWQANMDIQMVDGPIGIAYYVCSYICKAEPNTLKEALSETLKTFETSCDGENLRSRLSKIGFCVLKHRTLSAQEAAYRIGHLQLVWYSRQIVRVMAMPPDKLYRRLKPQSMLEQLPVDSTDIFDYNIRDYYYARPSVLKNLSLFSFARLWIVRKVLVGKNEWYKLSLSQQLYCQMRSKPAVVRVTKPARGTDDYYYSVMLLFYPHQSPDQLIQPYSCAKDAFLAKHELFDKSAVNIGYRMEEIESIIASLHLHDVETDIVAAPNTDENNTEPVPIDSFSNFPCDTTCNNNNNNNSCDFNMTAVDIHSHEQQWHSLSTGVNVSQFNEHCKTLTADQQQVLKFVQNTFGKDVMHIFITGPGGVGKSFLIKVLVEYMTLFTASVSGCIPIAVLAPTGVAAFNIKGKTIHSALHLPVQHAYSTSYSELSAKSLKQIRSEFCNVHTILIDEVSMVSALMLEHIHLRLQSIFNNDLPFGGLNIFLVGDFFQLRPVRGKFAFCHETLWPLFHPFFLNTNLRQCRDTQFRDLLSRMRIGLINQSDIVLLKSRLTTTHNVEQNILHIFSTRESVRNHNTKIQSTLTSPEVTYSADHYFSEKDLEPNQPVLNSSLIPCDDRDAGGLPSFLTFSVGTRIMLVRNICIRYGLINGAQGYVTNYHLNSISGKLEYIYVLFDHKDSIPSGVCRQDGTVSISVYRQEFLFNGRYIIREMFPLVLSWAATVHKVQGLTLPSAAVCIDETIFQHGQAYVALSRVKSLDGLRLLALNLHKITVDQSVVELYLNLHSLS